MNDSFHLHTLPNASNKTPVLNKACSEVLSSCADSHQGEGRQRQRSADLSTTLMKHELRRNLFVERGPGHNTAFAEENLLMPSGLTGVSAVTRHQLLLITCHPNPIAKVPRLAPNAHVSSELE